MSAKLLYNLSDENPNLNKQFGCMNGIFQVFYRQHYPARRVSVGGDELKSLPSGNVFLSLFKSFLASVLSIKNLRKVLQHETFLYSSFKSKIQDHKETKALEHDLCYRCS